MVGVFSQAGQMFLTSALQKEPVAGVAIINYTGLVYALLAGSLIFSEPQSTESLAGMLLVVFGVLLSVVYSKRMRDVEKIESSVS
jgi:drug/metabolite transporter (DMT)-like permease